MKKCKFFLSQLIFLKVFYNGKNKIKSAENQAEGCLILKSATHRDVLDENRLRRRCCNNAVANDLSDDEWTVFHSASVRGRRLISTSAEGC